MSSPAKNGLLVACAVLCGVGLSAKPWMLARAEGARAAQTVRRAEADEARLAHDRSVEGRLNTELGKEELLRSQGYHRKGEQALP